MRADRRDIVVARTPLRALLGGALVGGALLAGTLAGCGGDTDGRSGSPAAQATGGGARSDAAAVGARGAVRASGAGGAAGVSLAGDANGEGAAGDPAAMNGGDADGDPKPPAEAQTTPRTIYYDLTAFDWYRRGEPLVIDGRGYRPGDVRATGERKLEHGGEYQGVDFYIAPGGAEQYDTLYVPVYSGYWLTFTPTGGVEAERQ